MIRLPFQVAAIPIAQTRGGFVGSLEKTEQRGPGRRRIADVLIHQDELPQSGVIERRGRKHGARRVT